MRCSSKASDSKRVDKNFGLVYKRGIWRDETLITLEPGKNITSSKKNTRMLENNDLSLLTLASEHKITSATRQLKDKKLHYESGFPKWLSDVSSHSCS